MTSYFLCARLALSSSWNAMPNLLGPRRQPRVLPKMLLGARTARPLTGWIWPKDGYVSIA
jgi:hypothetical protein